MGRGGANRDEQNADGVQRKRENGKTPAETAKAIDDAYPFGDRAHHPYKVWLRERRLFFAQHGLPRNGKSKTQKEQLDDLFARMENRMHWARPNAEITGSALLRSPG